tara:strand:- start:7525 stop:7704 length:180 start_codon:yes stop_codon:yes gene_type:complete
MKDIRLCEVWLSYSDGQAGRVKVLLDIDECIETQVFDSFDMLTDDGPDLIDFKWKEVEE